MISDRASKYADLIDQVRSFRIEHVDPNVAQWEQDRVMATDALRSAAELGLLRIQVPTERGGLGLGFDAKLAVIEALSETSMAFAFSLVNTQNIAAKIANEGTDDMRVRYLASVMAGERFGSTALTEPSAGSDFAAIRTTAERVDGGWRLNGEKAWITNAAASDVIVCYAQTDPSARGGGIASFLIDGQRDGFERVAPYDLLGGHVIGTGGFKLNNYFAPDDDLFSPPGEAFKTALASINGARTYVAAMCCAMVRASLVVAVDYGSGREAFGRPIIEHQGLGWSLADVANQLEAAELLTDKAADAVGAELGADAVLPAAHAKKFATEMAEPAIAACIQAMGAEGLRDHYPLGRHMACARIANYVDGSTQIQTDRIAKSLRSVYGTATRPR